LGAELLLDLPDAEAKPAEQTATQTQPAISIDFDAPIPSLIAILANILTRSISRHCRLTYNIGSIDQRILMLLRRRSELSASQIADLTDLDKAAVSRSLAVLSRERLVTIVPIRPAARLKLIRLTEKGSAVSEEIGRRSAERLETMFANVPQSERDGFRSLLSRLITVSLNLDIGSEAERQKPGKKAVPGSYTRLVPKRTGPQLRPRRSPPRVRP
jgi:DNA-binding MarR family transcriptional regulator